jgi:RNA recognition motif-containing protein
MLPWRTSSRQSPTYGVEDNLRMSFTVFLGNLPAWVTADDIRGWLAAENLVADAIKVIRNPETQESKGFAFIESPNTEEMNSIIRRFDRAPLEDRLLRANPAQPPKPKGQIRPTGGPDRSPGHAGAGPPGGHVRPRSEPHAASTPIHAAEPQAAAAAPVEQRPPRRGKKSAGKKPNSGGPSSAFAEELAKAL